MHDKGHPARPRNARRIPLAFGAVDALHGSSFIGTMCTIFGQFSFVAET